MPVGTVVHSGMGMINDQLCGWRTGDQRPRSRGAEEIFGEVSFSTPFGLIEYRKLV